MAETLVKIKLIKHLSKRIQFKMEYSDIAYFTSAITKAIVVAADKLNVSVAYVLANIIRGIAYLIEENPDIVLDKIVNEIRKEDLT